MKRFKVTCLALAMIFISVTSFTKSNLNSNFYRFTGDSNSIGQVMDYTNYEAAPNACDDIDGELCGIYLNSYQSYGQHASPSEIQPYIYSLYYSALFEVAMNPHIRMHV
jgi:hypothetical protein